MTKDLIHLKKKRQKMTYHSGTIIYLPITCIIIILFIMSDCKGQSKYLSQAVVSDSILARIGRWDYTNVYSIADSQVLPIEELNAINGFIGKYGISNRQRKIAERDGELLTEYNFPAKSPTPKDVVIFWFDLKNTDLHRCLAVDYDLLKSDSFMKQTQILVKNQTGVVIDMTDTSKIRHNLLFNKENVRSYQMSYITQDTSISLIKDVSARKKYFAPPFEISPYNSKVQKLLFSILSDLNDSKILSVILGNETFPKSPEVFSIRFYLSNAPSVTVQMEHSKLETTFLVICEGYVYVISPGSKLQNDFVALFDDVLVNR